MASRNHRLARLVEIIILVQSAETWGPKQLAEHFGISDTRIYQDIKELSSAGVPITYSGKGYIIENDFLLPALNLTPDEIFLLLFPEIFFRSKKSEPLRDKVRAKLLSCLPKGLRKYFSQALDRTDIQPESTTERDKVFELIHKAVALRRRVVVEYRSMRAEDYEERTLDPLGLTYRGHGWYVIALCHRSNEIRTFRLNRIRSIKLCQQVFQYPENFSLADHMAGRWGIFDGEVHDVVIRFKPLAARLVENASMVQNGSLMQMSDGSAIFRGRLRGIQEIGWWLMKYGENAEVVQPPELREQMITMIREMAGLYGLSTGDDDSETLPE